MKDQDKIKWAYREMLAEHGWTREYTQELIWCKFHCIKLDNPLAQDFTIVLHLYVPEESNAEIYFTGLKAIAYIPKEPRTEIIYSQIRKPLTAENLTKYETRILNVCKCL